MSAQAPVRSRRRGISLSCVLCGGDDRTVGPARYMQGAVEHAKLILARAGLDFDYLNAERQAEVTWAVQEAARALVKRTVTNGE